MLLHGQLPGGKRMGEEHWAAELGVHRGALREALGLLNHEGLLVEGERGGYFVPNLERADLDDILELRAALEVGAVRRLGRLGHAIEVQPLRAICRTMQHLVDADMPLGFAEADRRFHETIIELAGNQRMTRAYLQAPVIITVNPLVSDPSRRANMKKTLREHETFCDLLAAGQYEEAARALEKHLFLAHTARRNLRRETELER
jgi:DNA-binding GntR family transcriptional regulator